MFDETILVSGRRIGTQLNPAFNGNNLSTTPPFKKTNLMQGTDGNNLIQGPEETTSSRVLMKLSLFQGRAAIFETSRTLPNQHQLKKKENKK